MFYHAVSMICHQPRKGFTCLVEEVRNGLCESSVRPSSMDKYEASEEAELADGVVRGHNRSTAFHTSNPDTNMRFLNHGDIVGTITDREGQAVEAGLDHVHNSSLLRWTDSATEHRPALFAEKKELLLD